MLCNKKRLCLLFQVLSYILGMLRNALDQPDLRSRSEGSSWSAQEIAVGLGNLLFNERNLETMLDRDVVALLVSLIGKGGIIEKECAANSLWIIAKNSKGKAKIKESASAMEELSRTSKSANQAVQEAAKRVLLELRETAYRQGNPNITIKLSMVDLIFDHHHHHHHSAYARDS